METPWLEWIMELQSIAQAGLHYSKDIYDIERFERLREITAEMMSLKSGLSTEVVKDLFCNEKGYQTPKVETRAVIFGDGGILLVKEKTTGNWSLPGGWMDINESVRSNTVKEAREEAGLEVVPVRLLAVQDRNKHNKPRYAYGICKVFVLCDILSGQFQANTETLESGFFAIEELPEIDNDKNTPEQIRMCFDAYRDSNWAVPFD